GHLANPFVVDVDEALSEGLIVLDQTFVYREGVHLPGSPTNASRLLPSMNECPTAAYRQGVMRVVRACSSDRPESFRSEAWHLSESTANSCATSRPSNARCRPKSTKSSASSSRARTPGSTWRSYTAVMIDSGRYASTGSFAG